MSEHPSRPASTEHPVLSVERTGHVATVFLDRPEKRNAMDMAFFTELPEVMGELGADEEVRAVVLAARGPAFSVGLDLKAMAGLAGKGLAGEGPAGEGFAGEGPAGEGLARGADGELGPPSQAHRPPSQAPLPPSQARLAMRTLGSIRSLQSSISSVAECPKPVVAAVHGWCIGGGVDLVSACDIRLAAADAVFSVRETRMAMVADLGSLQRLPLVLPLGRVAELAFTGRDVDAAFAERIGLVNAVYDDAKAVLAAAHELAEEIAANSPLAVQGTKEVLSAAHRGRVRAGLEYVAAWNAGQLRSHDLTEAVTAFFEHRPPRFTGE